MELLSQEVLEATKKRFDEDLEKRVTLVLFTQEPRRLTVPDYLKGQECHFCKETRQLVEEVSSLSDKINLEIYDFEGDNEKVSSFGIDKIPAVAVQSEKDFGIRFFGVPKTIFNEDVSLDGAVPEDQFLESLLKAAGSESSKKNE